MIFALGVVVLGGVLITQKVKAYRAKNKLMIESLIAPTEPAPSTSFPLNSPHPKQDINLDRSHVEHHLLLSGGTLGLWLISITGIPFVGPCSALGLLYLDLYFLRRAYVEWQTEGLNGMTDAVVATGLLVTRQYGAGALFVTTYFASRTLVQQTQTSLAQRLTCHAQPNELAVSDVGPFIHQVSSANDTAWIRENENLSASSPMRWQTLIRKGTLPFVTLSAISLPFLGARRSLAVLLTNFGYDYRLTAPLSTLTYMELAAEHEIVIGDWRAFEQLNQVDVIVLDEELFTNTISVADETDVSVQSVANPRWLNRLQPQKRREWILIRRDTARLSLLPAYSRLPKSVNTLPSTPTIAPEEVGALIQQLQAAGRTVCLVRSTAFAEPDASQADVIVTVQRAKPKHIDHETLAGAQLSISSEHPDSLYNLFQLADDLAYTQKQGFALTLLPSLVGLGGIYFFHFNALSAVLLDSSALAAGVLNAKWPQLSKRFTALERQTVDRVETIEVWNQ